MKISVVIPTFNAERYLPKCLESIRLQNDRNIEVIVVDGQSSDNTLAIVREHADLITTFLSEKDRGQGDAVTKGLKLATGDIHHWHAADDIVLPRAFERVRASFASDPSLGLVISDGLAFNGADVVNTGKCRWISYRTALYFFARFQSDCVYWRSSLTEAALPLDITQPLSVDEDFFLRLWKGHAHAWLPVPLGAFRVRPDQLSRTLNRGMLAADRRKTREKIFARDQISPIARRGTAAQMLVPHLFRNVLLPTARDGLRLVERIADGDRRRRQLALALNAYATATNEAGARRYAELEELILAT